MVQSTKKRVVLLCALVTLFCFFGVFFTSATVRAETSETSVVSHEIKIRDANNQIKITFDKAGDNGSHTITPLRQYLVGLLGLDNEFMNVYFDEGDMYSLKINVDKDKWDSLPRVITLGTELDINKGSDGTSSCTLKEEYTISLDSNGAVATNNIKHLHPLGFVWNTHYHIKIDFENQGTYNQWYLDEAVDYVVVNGIKLSEVDGVMKWYEDSEPGSLSFFIPIESGVIRCDGSDLVSFLSGLKVGDTTVLKESKTYYFTNDGGVEVVGAEILSCTEVTPDEKGNRIIEVMFSEYGNNHGNAMLAESNGWRYMVKFNGKSIYELGYTCYFSAEKTIVIDERNEYQLGKKMKIFIPATDFKDDGTDSLVFEPNMKLNTQDPDRDPDVLDTRLVRGLTYGYSADPVEVVKGLIDALPEEITLDDKDDVLAAQKAFEALGASQSRVTNSSKLTAAMSTIVMLEKFAGTELKAINARLDGKICMEFYYVLSETAKADDGAFVEFVVGDNDPVQVYVKDVLDTVDAQGRYTFVCEVSVAQMTEQIKVYFVDGEGYEHPKNYSYSVRDYADWLLSDENVDKTDAQVALVKAMLNYGAYAQLYFNVNVDNLANAGLYSGSNPVESVTQIANTNVITGSAKGLTVKTYEFFAQSDAMMRIYFTLKRTDVQDYSFELNYTDDGETKSKTLTATKDDNRYYIDITDISAVDLDGDYKITITNLKDNTVFEMSTNPLCYANTVLATSKDAKLINLVKAMYLYNVAANTFFGK